MAFVSALALPAKRTVLRLSVFPDFAAGLSFSARYSSLNAMVFRFARRYSPGYPDSFDSEQGNSVDKTLTFIDSAHRADERQLQQWLQSLMLRLKQWRAARKDLAILRNLSDYELKDIGLCRSDLMSIESGEIFRDDSRSRR